MKRSPRLWAISDLHLGNETNRRALAAVPDHGDDWLIVAGDVGERDEHIAGAFDIFTGRFARVLWVPGNHELWTVKGAGQDGLRGEARYRALVELARVHGVVTPEDPYPVWAADESGPPVTIALLFLLYDYTFRPDHVSAEEVLDWAMEEEILCTDEYLLHPDPHASRQDWCAARCALTEARLDALEPVASTVLVNHWPLRQDLAILPRVPRFSPWCGTRRSESYHVRYRARAVVYGHLHIRGGQRRDDVPFEEVSLGYPQQWSASRGIVGYLRQILPRS